MDADQQDYRAMLTNVGQLSIYDLLPSRKKVSLLDYFADLPDKHKVQVLVMDMWRPYRDVGRNLFPNKMIVVDKFHVVRMANDALEMVRKKIRKELDRQPRLKLKDDRFILLRRAENLSEDQQIKAQEWFSLFPVLKYAYEAKERFFDIYQEPTRSAAEIAAERWVDNLDPSIAREFLQVRTALGNWGPEIFNYFEYPVTNAYIESVNGLAKNIQRMGRGYSFEVIRARLLYEERALKGARTSVRRHAHRRDSGGKGFGLVHPGQFGRARGIIDTTNYGAHLPTLLSLLEEGYFEN